jgi:hypothetical protein
MRAEVTEHQLIERECGCGHRTKAATPGGADAPVQYGPRIAAVTFTLPYTPTKGVINAMGRADSYSL